MNRRNLLKFLTIPTLVAVSGCTEHVHRARGVDTPADLRVRNHSDESQVIALRLERNGENVFDGAVELGEDNTIEWIDGDDFREAEFTEAGTYTIDLNVNGARVHAEAEISWRYLADCNLNTLEIAIYEDEIRAGLSRTDAGCRFPDTLG